MNSIIAVGTKNPAKVKAVETVLTPLGIKVESLNVSSNVASQPKSDQETQTGAINRTKNCLNETDRDWAIGLEGGVMMIGSNMYITNWGAIADRRGHVITASGARFLLPQDLVNGIREGKELGDVIDHYAKGHNIRKNEGTVGILTNGFVTRGTMFEHIVHLLIGQYQYYYDI